MRDSLRPPKPLDLPWAATAERRSKNLKMISARAWLSTLRGIKVLKESRAMLESANQVSPLGFMVQLVCWAHLAPQP